MMTHLENTNNDQPLFSIIITCYNYNEYLRASVASVIFQTYKNFEIIIVNDGSTDNSLEVAKEIQTKFSNVSISIVDQVNSGQPAIARNNGILQAKGKFVLCLDADDMIEATMLQKIVDAHRANPSISVFYSNAIFFNDDESVFKPAGFFDLSVLSKTNQLFCCSGFLKSAWEKVGGYKTNVKGYEDWDFWITLAEAGFNAIKIEEPLFLYRTGKEGLFADAEKRDLILKANIVKNHPNLYDNETKMWAETTLTSLI